MTKPTSFALDDDVELWARLYAKAKGISMSRVANRAIRAFIRGLSEEERQFILSFQEERVFIEEDEPLAMPPDMSANDESRSD